MKIFKFPLVLFLFVFVIFVSGCIYSDDVKTNMNTYNSMIDDSIYEINEDLGPNEVNIPVAPDLGVNELGVDLGDDEVIFP